MSNPASRSKYTPAWEHLKHKQTLTVIVKVPKGATQADKERQVVRLRKGISRRKELDLEFNSEYSSGRVHVQNINWETMEVTLELRNMPYEDFVIPETLAKL